MSAAGFPFMHRSGGAWDYRFVFLLGRVGASALRMEGIMIRKLMVAAAAALMLVGCTTVDPVTGERTANRTGSGAILGAIGGAPSAG